MVAETHTSKITSSIVKHVKESGWTVVSHKFPFSSHEKDIAFGVLSIGEELADNRVFLAYHVGATDVPQIPLILVSTPKDLPKYLVENHANVILLKEDQCIAAVTIFLFLFESYREIIPEATAQSRIELRQRLLTMFLKDAKVSGYIKEKLE